MPESGIYAMRQALRRQRMAIKAGDRPGFYAADTDFHAAPIEALRLTVTLGILRVLGPHVERARRQCTLTDGLKAQTMAEHEAVVEAMERRDAETASGAMSAHLQSVSDRFEAAVSQRPWLFTTRRANGAPE